MKKIFVPLSAALALGACTSKIDAAYRSCVDAQHGKLMKQADSGPAQLKETLEKDGLKLAESVCAPIKTICKDDFDGTLCQQTIQTLTK